MKKVTILFIMMFACSLILNSVVKNPDKPLKGTWDFKLQKVWEIRSEGDVVLARPAQMEIAEDGTFYVHDFKTHQSYIFDKNGKYLKTFAPRGEGPGEVKRFMWSFLVNNKYIATDYEKLHYFTQDGKYLKSVANSYFIYTPHVFLNEDEFISAPQSIVNLRDNKGKVSLVNLKSQDAKTLAEFDIYEKGVDGRGKENALTMFVVGLSPGMEIAYDEENKRFFYGRNDNYVINVADLNGKLLNTFSVEREKKKITEQEKIKEFEGRLSIVSTQRERVLRMVKGLPNELAYYHQIAINKGAVYVFAWGFGFLRETQEIDIFSPDGKYQYRATLNFGKNVRIRTVNLTLQGDYLYAILQDEKGEIKIAKYKVSLPKF